VPQIQSLQIRVRGIVQGVGFRPWVWHLAQTHGITGQVWNDASGVLIQAWASRASLDGFVAALREGPPPLARIETIETSPLPKLPTDWQAETAPSSFEIVTSRAGEIRTDIAPDAATCTLCLEDILSPGNRRQGYAFTNCTHCGPRLSIIQALPYDRANTSMAGFALCPACLKEYQNPADRRFHAQPNACPACGPRLWLEDAQGQRLECTGAPLALAAALLKQGQILAIKGIGGFHLACDATNAVAIQRLRQRKARNHKAFALMARDLEMLRRYAWASQAEAELLASPAAPIVILRANTQAPLPDALAPGQDSLGFMLPYSPLHQLLFAELDRPLVMTSGNRSDEPQCIDNEDAKARLSHIADALLLHDRPIQNRLDDSLARLALGQPQLLRRARGYTPEPLRLPAGFEQAPPLLAMGAELKSTFALIKAGRLVVSQHLGDLEDAHTLRDYLHQLALYQRLYALRPEVIAIDAHLDYLSSQQGQRLGERLGIPVVRVAHHHAHIAAVMLEHGLSLATGPVLGLALDGLGLGFDAQGSPELWGGEFLLADYLDYRRLGRLRPVALPGGAKAMHEPWRNALAQLLDSFSHAQVRDWCRPAGLLPAFADKPLDGIARMLERGLNAPLASSAGRLFDALAAALGICVHGLGYEGQTGVELETLARPWMDSEQAHAYGVAVQEGHNQLLELSWRPLWQGLLADIAANTDTGRMAARFHWALIKALGSTVIALCQTQGLSKVVLSGGVMQNLLLLEGLTKRLTEAGLEVLIPRRYPANDGGLSLGQAAITAARWIQTN
jgi:hydrogenase maturation protein HypF